MKDASTSPQNRIALFDNVKALLIVLVVVGHVAHPVHIENPALSALFDIIYLFHMPLFVLLSGLFAKGAFRDDRLNVNRIISFLVLGFAFQAALLLINGQLPGDPECLLLFTSAPWYLIALAAWYALTPLLSAFGPGAGMAVCLALSYASGFVDVSSGMLAISRTLAFLPWFALGYYVTADQVLTLRRAGGRLAWFVVGAFALVAVARLLDAQVYEWFFYLVYGDNPYRGDVLAALAGRTLVLAIGALGSFAVLRLVPEGETFLTGLGQRTLQVYVLHRLIRAWLTFHTGLYDQPFMLDPVAGTVAVLGLSAAITWLCAAPALQRPFDALLRKKWVARRG